MKKLLSIILCAIMLIATASPAFANEPINDNVNVGLEAYASRIISDYINIRIEDIENVQDTDIFSLSQGYQIINHTDLNSRMFFLFQNEKCIGKLVATSINGEYASSFVPYEIPAVTEAYENHIPFVVIAGEYSSFIKAGNRTYRLSGNEEFVQHDFQNMTENEIIQLSPVNFHYNEVISAVVKPSLLGVPHVGNGRSPDTGKGLCWAASVASIGAYTNNDDDPLTALQLYNNLKTPNTSDFPIGTDTWVARAFEFYSIIPKQVANGLTYSGVKSLIEKYTPMFASLKDSSGNIGHGVVICGCHTSSNLGFYDMMDPNVDNYVTSNGVSTTGSSKNFIYPADGTTYTTWSYAMHKR